MFKKIFKKDVALSEGNAQIILNRLSNMSEEEQIEKQDELYSLALSYDDPLVRRASTELISDFAKLSQLLTHNCDETTQTAALRIAQNIDFRSKVLDLPQLLEIPCVQLSLLQQAANIEQAKLVKLHSQIDIATLVPGCVSDEVRQWLVSQIADLGQLQELEKASRNNNKNVNRIAREQITKIKIFREQLADREQESERIRLATIAFLEKELPAIKHLDSQKVHLVYAILNQHRKHNLAVQTGNKSALDAQLFASADLTRLHLLQEKIAKTEKLLAQAALELDERLEQQRAEQDRLKQMQKESLDSEAAEPEKQSEPLTDKNPNGIEEHSVARTLLKEMQDQLLKNEEILKKLGNSKPEPQNYHNFWGAQAASAKLSNNLQALDKMQPAMADTDLLDQLKQSRFKLHEFVEHSKGVSTRLTNQLNRSLDKLDGLLLEGNMKSATGLHADCRTKSRLLPADPNNVLLSRFNDVDKKFNELKDWRAFAAQPKQIELCEAVEKLADNALDPETQADSLKRLRKKWQELGRANRALSLRFDAAASRAFVPCQAYFDEQSNIRKRNLEKRKTVLIQLGTYIAENDWNKASVADWKASEKILRAARSEWNSYIPIDRSKMRAVQKKFDAACEQIHKKLHEEWNKNLDQKQELVNRIRTLAEAETSLAEIIDEAKSLQKSWREVGVTPRVPDQRLWREFRKFSDKIFARREEETRQHKETLVKENAVLQAEYEALLASISQYETNLSEQNTVVPEIKPLVVLHRALTTKTSNAPASMTNKVRKLGIKLKDLEKSTFTKQRAVRLEILKALDTALIALESSIFTGIITKPEELEESLLKITTLFQTRLPEGEYARIAAGCKKRVCDLFALYSNDDTEERELYFIQAARDQTETVVRAELEAGLNSNASDQQLRMQMQVERLKSGLAKRQTETLNPERLALDWCSTQSCGKHRAVLSARYFAAMAALLLITS